MEKVQSLADFLGTNRQETEPTSVVAAPTTFDVKAFSTGIVHSDEFRKYVLNGLIIGDLPAAVVCRLLDHAGGKPVERVEVKDTTDDVDEMSVEQCESEAMRLLEIARQLRTDESTTDGEAVH